MTARRLTFVTGNPGKVRELQHGLGPVWRVEADGRGYPEIQADTLAEVTDHGADHLLASGLAPPFCLEDSGLFVHGLSGFPGVYSRYALDTLGVAGLLRTATGLAQRDAAFRTDLRLVTGAGPGERIHFSGVCEGRLSEAPLGEGGFGFDPIFVPRGHEHTFAQMDVAEKGRISHRGLAVRALLEHLQKETAKA